VLESGSQLFVVPACTIEHMYRTLICEWCRIRLVPHLLKRHYCVSRGGVGCACDVFFPLRRRQGGGFQYLHYHPVPPPGVGGLRHILLLKHRYVPNPLLLRNLHSLSICRLFSCLELHVLFICSFHFYRGLIRALFRVRYLPLLRFFEIRIAVFTYCFIRT
jgi:hypothetical protein